MAKIDLFLSGQITERVLGRKATAIEWLCNRAAQIILREEKSLREMRRPRYCSIASREDCDDVFQENLEYGWAVNEARQTIKSAKDTEFQLILIALSCAKHKAEEIKAEVTCYYCWDGTGEKSETLWLTCQEFFELLRKETENSKDWKNEFQSFKFKVGSKSVIINRLW